MATITTRSGKGSALTHEEMDANLTNLNTDKLEDADILAGTGVTKTVTTAGDVQISIGQAVETGSDVTFNSVTADQFTGDITGAVTIAAKSGEAFSRGDAVYISGISGNFAVVSKADADVASKMPALGLADTAATAADQDVTVVIFGELTNLNTSTYTTGNELFVSTTAGGLTTTAPTGESAALQKIAKVEKSHASTGILLVMGAMRTNAVPNLNTGNIFYGNGSNQAGTVSLDTQTGTLGYIKEVVSDTTPQLGGNLDAQTYNITSLGTLNTHTVPGGTGTIALTSDITLATLGVTATAGELNTLDGITATTLELNTLDGITATVAELNYTDGVTSNIQTQLDAKLALAGGTMSGAIAMGTNKITGMGDPTVAQDAATKAYVDSNLSSLTYISNVVEDTTPQLGGSLDVNGNSIVSTTNGNITLAPNGTGNVVLGTLTFDADQTLGVGLDNYVLTYDNATGLISLEASAGGGLANIVEDTTPQLGGNLDAQTYNITNLGTVNTHTVPGGTGTFALTSDLYTNTDVDAHLNQSNPTDGYVLSWTSGDYAWVAQSGGGGGDVVSDTTPQLGGNLDINGFDIVSALTNQPIKIAPSGSGEIILDANKVVQGRATTVLGDSAYANAVMSNTTNTDMVLTYNVPTAGFTPWNDFDGLSTRRFGTRVYYEYAYVPSSLGAQRHYYDQNIKKLELDGLNTTSSNARYRLNYNNMVLDSKASTVRPGASNHGPIMTANNLIFENSGGSASDLSKVTNLFVGNWANSSLAEFNLDDYYVVQSNSATNFGNLKIDRVTHFYANTGDNNANTIYYGFVDGQTYNRDKFGSIENYREYIQESTHSSGAGITLNYTTGQVQKFTLTSDVTSFSMSNWPTNTYELGSMTVILVQDGTGSRSVSLTAGGAETFYFAGGNKTIATGANEVTIISIEHYGGGDYYWHISGEYTT